MLVWFISGHEIIDFVTIGFFSGKGEVGKQKHALYLVGDSMCSVQNPKLRKKGTMKSWS